MTLKLDVLNFKTGEVAERVTLPSEVENAVSELGERSLLKKIHHFLHVSKKISFVKTSNSKGISEISGTTKKPHKQKGTGRARQGSLRSPQFRGGACIFGPKPITARYKINKKERNNIKEEILHFLIKNSSLRIIDSLSYADGKTKTSSKLIEPFMSKEHKRIMIVANGTEDCPDNVLSSFSNIANVAVDRGLHFNIFKISNSSLVLITKSAIQKLLKIS